MGRKKKLFLFLFGVALLASASLLGAALYYYHRPAQTKALIEEAISRMTGTACTIEELAYSLRPPAFKAKGVLLVGHVQGFVLEIPELSAGFALDGPFGQKTLSVTHLRVKGFSLRTHQEVTLENAQAPQESFPPFRRALRTLVSVLLFREISIEAMQMSAGHVAAEFGDIRLTLNGVRGGTAPGRSLEIACETKVEWPSQKISLLAQEVLFTSDQVLSFEEHEMLGELKASKARFEHPEFRLEDFSLDSKLILDRDRMTLSLLPLEIAFNDLRLLRYPTSGHAPLKGNLSAETHLEWRNRKVIAPDFRLFLNPVLDIRGSLVLEAVDNLRLQLKGLGGYLIPREVEPFLPDPIRKPMAPLKVNGPVGVHGDAAISGNENQKTLDLDLEVQLAGNEISYTAPLFSSRARVAGTLHARGEFPNLQSSIQVLCNPIDFQSEWMDSRGGSLDLSVQGENPVFQVRNATLSLPEARIRSGKTDLRLNSVQFHVQTGTIDLEKGIFNVPDVELQTSLLRNLKLSVKRTEHETTLEVGGRNIQLLESALALKWIGPEWQISGQDLLQAGLTLQDQGGWKAFSQLHLDGSRFDNAALDWTGENLSMVLSLEASGHTEHSSMTWKTSLEVMKGESLLERFYLDLGKNSFALSADGVYDPASKSLRLSGLRSGLKDLLTVSGRGDLSLSPDSQTLDFAINVPKTEVGPIFRHFVVEPYRQEKAFLSDLDVNGTVSTEMEVRSRRGEFSAKGRCIWDGGSVESPQNGLSIKGIYLDLPLWLRVTHTGDHAGSMAGSNNRSPGPRGSDTGEPLKGRLNIESAAFPVLPTQSLEFPLEARPNQLASTSPIMMRVPGGQIEWGPFVLMDPLSSSFSLKTDLTVDKVKLDQILAKVWERPIRGSARGKLNAIEISGDEIRSEGKIEANLFGGTLSVTNPGAYGLLSVAPVIHLDAQWEGLRLGELTEGTPFGKVEGVLRGHAKGIEISGGEPQKFDLFMETVPKEGVPQTISTKAVDNISQIGGGQSALTGVFASFFKEFPYEKIGVRASLENDLFRINGTIKEDGKEYIVKRGGFSGVNVVNQNPDNRISFKDMVKRVKRVASSGREAIVK